MPIIEENYSFYSRFMQSELSCLLCLDRYSIEQYICRRPSSCHSQLVSHRSIQLGCALGYLIWPSIPVCYTKRMCPRAYHQDDLHRSLHKHWDYKALPRVHNYSYCVRKWVVMSHITSQTLIIIDSYAAVKPVIAISNCSYCNWSSYKI